MGLDSYVGDIILWSGRNYVPADWLPCEGQELDMQTYPALGAVIAGAYGYSGGGRIFRLPDLRSRVAVGIGQSTLSGTVYSIGAHGGAEAPTLSVNGMPQHVHAFKAPWSYRAQNAQGANATPTAGQSVANSYGPSFNANVSWYVPASDTNLTALGGTSATVSGGVQATGGGKPYSNVQPCVGLQYIICANGMFPDFQD